MTLLPEKAIFWSKERVLILADLHLGKVTHFRKAGIGLPKAVENDNLDRLSQLILDHEPLKVILLGDLFHSTRNKEWDKFLDFMGRFAGTEFILVMGNHDILAEADYQAENLQCVQENLKYGPFLMTHHPTETKELYNLCGHVHPAIRLAGKGLQSMRLACFYFKDKQGILPAFGAFTGMHALQPSKQDAVFAISNHQVIKVL